MLELGEEGEGVDADYSSELRMDVEGLLAGGLVRTQDDSVEVAVLRDLSG